jgi:hypothetical protein
MQQGGRATETRFSVFTNTKRTPHVPGVKMSSPKVESATTPSIKRAWLRGSFFLDSTRCRFQICTLPRYLPYTDMVTKCSHVHAQ